ncbi:uncharacterized protein [Populus alba]|uniref:uncharacterized protein n=1 Tax=Populus alba TaxID=43335 RepID=UPI003CC6E1DC
MGSKQAAFDEGHTMLNRLANVSLLEIDETYRCVKMHDLVRDMAIQIQQENSQGMVKAGLKLKELPDVEEWTENLMRVSLLHNQIEEIPSSHSPRHVPSLEKLRALKRLDLVGSNFLEGPVMDSESSFTHNSPPIFNGENFQLWAVRMETHLEALDLWEAVEKDYEDHVTSISKGCLGLLEEGYAGDERIRGMQSLNLIREFELQRMKDSETIKEYSDKLMGIANRVRLLGTSFADSRIVEKLLVTVPEKYEASITTLENTKDLSKITLTELLNALQAQEQRRLMRQDHAIKGALQAKFADYDNKKFFRKNAASGSIKPNQGYNKGKFIKRNFPPCQHCNKSGHPPFKCWKRPDARCSKCNQLGHEAIICRFKNQKQEEDAQVTNQDDEDQMLVVPTEAAKVRIGNGECIEAKGKGTIAITTNSGTKTIADVLYVPNIDQNLLSVGQLIEKGMKFGKQNRKSFPRSTWRSSQKLQLIHTDVAGPLSTPSLNGSKYYLLFIDDFSRMCWIYFMKFKSEVAGILWSREYTSTKFNLYCEEADIEHKLTAPYTPEQNGVSERRNRYIMEMARCMLHEKNLPKVFWAEAASTAVFLQNRLPTKLLTEKTPFEVWYNYKPSLSFLKVFGSTCFVHIPQIKRDKLDKKAMQGIFVGYSTISKAYKVYLPQTLKITITRDVQFHEDDKWNWDETQEITVLDDQIITSLQNESIDESPVRGTRSLEEIYQRSNVVVCEPENYEDAQMNPAWQEAMKEEIHMIEKNHTWELVDRPDILYATNLLSRFMHCPSELHMRAAKRILRYIKGTCSFGVKFMQCSTIFSWSSNKQSIVAQSTAEAEFIVATAAVNQALWLQKLLRDLHMEEEEATEISVDNQAAIAISNNPVFHGKTKHFNIKLYFIREVQKNGDVKLLYCRTEDQMADLFTKALPANSFEFLTRLIGVCSP